MLRLVPVLLSASVMAQPVRVVVSELDVSGLEADRGQFLSDHLAQQLAMESGIKVTTREQMAAVLGLERQKQLLGCSAGASCMTELLGALGGEALVVGRVARVGRKFVVNLKLLSARNSDALSLASGTFDDEESILPFLGRSAQQFGTAIRALAPQGNAPSLRSRAWVPLVVGGTLGLAGGSLAVVSFLQAQRLSGNDPGITNRAQYLATVDLGRSTQLAAAVLLSCSAAALLTSGLMALLGGEPPVTAALAPSSGGAVLVLGGRW